MNPLRDDTPRVSVVIPAFHAHAFIAEAVGSILAQDGAPSFEVIIAPDDDSDYATALPAAAELHVLPPAGHHGIAHARNRAIAAARGELIALCDADDLWPPNYLEQLVPLALEHDIACVNTLYTSWTGETLRVPPVHGRRLNLSDYGRCLASIRPLWNKALGIKFQNVFAEDVLHTLHLAAITTGGIPIATDTHYILRERHGSSTWQDTERERDIIAAYTPLIHDVQNNAAGLGLAKLTSDDRRAIAEALQFWQFANRKYLDTGCKQSFIRFVAGREKYLWKAFDGSSR